MPVEIEEFVPDTMEFTIDMPNFPEWAIPFVTFVPKVHVEDGYDVDEILDDMVTYWQYFWRHIEDDHWEIHCYARMTAEDDDRNYISTFFTLDMVFTDERVWEEYRANKM